MVVKGNMASEGYPKNATAIKMVRAMGDESQPELSNRLEFCNLAHLQETQAHQLSKHMQAHQKTRSWKKCACIPGKLSKPLMETSSKKRDLIDSSCLNVKTQSMKR